MSFGFLVGVCWLKARWAGEPKSKTAHISLFLLVVGRCGQLCSAQNQRKIVIETLCALMVSEATIHQACCVSYVYILPLGTGVKSTQSVLSRLGLVCPCRFAFARGLFSTSIIFISSNPSLCAMNLSPRLCRLGDNFRLKIGSSPGRADLARGRAGLAQSNPQSL